MIRSEFEDRRVAIYARVSTEHEAQLSALENQIGWYKPILEARTNWSLVEQYIDEGITGTSAEKRPEFMRMIEDAKQKRFDLILTREVSRFARNTVDTLQYTRLLREYGVEVFFINDNIKTFDGDGELRLTIMATLAQDESRKTSIRVKAGQQTSMENGVLYGNGNILGYDRVGKELVINPEQAKTVRMIYDLYLSGKGVTTIQYELEKAGRLTAMGKTKWFASYISHMLKNSFYCGLVTYHKEFTPDYLKQKKIKNYGQIELTTVVGTHTPIVTVDEFQRVQEIIASRSKKISGAGTRRIGIKPHTTVWGNLLICQCGKRFNQHFHNRRDRNKGVNYQCYTAANRGSRAERLKRGLSTEETCDSPFLPGWKLDLMAKYIFRNYIENAPKVLELAYLMLSKHITDEEDTTDHTDLIRQKQDQIDRLNQKRLNLLEMREDGDIDKEYFRKRKQEIDGEMQKLTEEIRQLQPQNAYRPEMDVAARLSGLRKLLESYIRWEGPKIPDSIVEAFIDKIWVSKEEFRWYLRTRNANTPLENRMKIAEFTIDKEQAKAYVYSISTRKRVHKWTDLQVSIWM